MNCITVYRHMGWTIESFHRPKYAKSMGWTAYPPDYDPDVDNGNRIICGMTLREVKNEIEAASACKTP